MCWGWAESGGHCPGEGKAAPEGSGARAEGELMKGPGLRWEEEERGWDGRAAWKSEL